MRKEIANLIQTGNFENALKVTIAAALPAVIASLLGYFSIGLTLAIGALLTYPSDIPSNLPDKIKGLLFAAFIVAACNLTINFLHPYPFLLYPIVCGLILFLAMISVYGHRASMVSFSALLAVALAFSRIHTGWEMIFNSLYMFGGGIFYLFISVLFAIFRPHKYTRRQVYEAMVLTANYLSLRGDLWDIDADRHAIVEKQLEIQVNLNAANSNIREILIESRPDGGNSGQNRRLLLIFLAMNDIMELGISTGFDHEVLLKKFSNNIEVFQKYQQLAYSLSQTLRDLALLLDDPKFSLNISKLEEMKTQFENSVQLFSDENPAATDDIAILHNLCDYSTKQYERIKLIARGFTQTIESQDFNGRDRDLHKLLKIPNYRISTLFSNFSMESQVFRHSLRVTTVCVFAFLLGAFLPLQNVYWIILTLIVIMRPGYGLTKSRFYERIIGTVAGGIIAFGILIVLHDRAIITSLAIVAMILGFAFTASNYKVGATFITMYVVFLYSILQGDTQKVVEIRILDTIIGGLLAFFANHFLWPSWEFLNVREHISKALEANEKYIEEISSLYESKTEITLEYRISRRNAFVETGNLMASYQRMVQEPKSKQLQLAALYKLAVLNHAILSAAASLGTFIQTHHTTPASDRFRNTIAEILEKFELAKTHLIIPKRKLREIDPDNVKNDFASLKLDERTALATTEIAKLQEVQLVRAQLDLIKNLSVSVEKVCRSLKIN